MPSHQIAKPPRKLHLSRETLLRLDPPAPPERGAPGDPRDPGAPGEPPGNKRTQQGPTCSHEDGCVPPPPPHPRAGDPP